jgi:NAD(P)-dependent dehydrogenase (short-subunit alcohol dehydrogenase family)
MAKRWTTAAMPRLDERIAVITGANSGLGLEAAAALAASGATVVMACRDADKAQAAMVEVLGRVPQGRLESLALDLSDLASVRSFAERYKARHHRLDLLFNNAGVMATPQRRTRDGFELQIGTNHLGHFALTGLLLETLNATPGARIVNTFSMAYTLGRELDPEDLGFEHRPYKPWLAYGNSKLANVLFTFELDRRLRQAGLPALAVAAHPGFAATQLQFVGPQMNGSRLGQITWSLLNSLFAQSAAQGTLPLLYAATSPEVGGGDFIGPDGIGKMRGYPAKDAGPRKACDPQLAERLWAASERLTGVSYLQGQKRAA